MKPPRSVGLEARFRGLLESAPDAMVIVDSEGRIVLVSEAARVLVAAEGHVVRTATDALEALEVLRDFMPRLILMDIQLPGMDGLELTRRLKADPATRDIAIVGLTAYAMKGDEERIRAAGCDGYIAKPIDTRLLPDQIRRILEAPA